MHELWVELGASMRVLRTTAGISLRQAEVVSGRGRSLLSQVENAKARPPRELVEWYDAAFDGDGMLLSLYAEARTAYGPSRPSRSGSVSAVPGDAVAVESPLIAHGELVDADASLVAGWTLVNAGEVTWPGRCLQRLGARGGARLIVSDAATALEPCAPGGRITVRVPVHVPAVPGTFAAYWQIVSEAGYTCYSPTVVLSVIVTTAG